MKKLKLLGGLLIAFAVMSMMFISSCKKDTATGDLTPTVNYLSGTGLTSADATVDSGTMITVSISAFSNTSSNTNLNEVIFTVTFNNVILTYLTKDSIMKKNVTSFTNNYSFAVDWVGSARVAVQVKDDDGQTKEAFINITGKKPTTGNPLTSYLNLNMGDHTSTFGSYLDAETGTVYLVSQVSGSTTIKDAIDIIFDLGLLNTVAAIITSTGAKYASTTLTSANFDAMTTDATFGAYSATLTQIAIANGQVVFFQTKGGKKGLVKVKSITGPDLNIDLKIQP